VVAVTCGGMCVGLEVCPSPKSLIPPRRWSALMCAPLLGVTSALSTLALSVRTATRWRSCSVCLFGLLLLRVRLLLVRLGLGLRLWPWVVVALPPALAALLLSTLEWTLAPPPWLPLWPMCPLPLMLCCCCSMDGGRCWAHASKDLSLVFSGSRLARMSGDSSRECPMVTHQFSLRKGAGNRHSG
jgi:hypothetical protein